MCLGILHVMCNSLTVVFVTVGTFTIGIALQSPCNQEFPQRKSYIAVN